MSTVLKVENVSKLYRLGIINRKMLVEDLQSRWALFRGKPDPNAPVDAKPRDGSTPDHIWAVRDVSFDVQDGDVLGVIGHNGSGKSTLLKLLSRITAPTNGRILIKGKVASLLEVGTGFHQELTGRDNVFLNGVILGMTQREVAKRFDEIVAFSGVEDFIDTPVKRYSSGMRVRLAFAVAAHLEAQIMIIDEVLAVGDAAFQSKCIGKIGEVARQGRTVLFVSHNAAAVENLCTRGIVLKNGRLVFAGTQTEAIHHYVNTDQHVGVSLRERTDRAGSGEIRVVSMDFQNSSGQPTGIGLAGQPLSIRLGFENPAGHTFPALIATITVRTEFDAPVFTQHNRLTGESFGELGAAGTLVCHIPRLPLPPSSYRLGFSLVSEPKGGRVVDSMETAAQLDVEGGNFFGTGILPPVQRGVCLVDGQWRLESKASSPATDASA